MLNQIQGMGDFGDSLEAFLADEVQRNSSDMSLGEDFDVLLSMKRIMMD